MRGPAGGRPRQDRARQEVRMDAQAEHRLHGGGGDRRVQRRQHELTAAGGVDGRLGGHGIADLADHDDVRRLAKNAPEELGEPDLGLEVHLRLPQAADRVLDRVFNRVDLALAVVEAQTA